MARRGFTLIELVITIVVAGLLLLLVVRALGDVQQKLSARQAARVYESMHARARAHAVEHGVRNFVVLDIAKDSAAIVRDGEVIEALALRDEFGTDVQSTATNPITVCFGSRGYADESCTSFTGVVKVEFKSGTDVTAIQIYPLGQIVR